MFSISKARLQTRIALALGVFAVVLAACGDSGPVAEAPGAAASLCGDNYCIEYPGDWNLLESSADFASFSHPTAPDTILATVGQVNMEGVTVQAGGSWPALPDSVIEHFWALVDDGNATMSSQKPRLDGSVWSVGSYSGGRMWILLAPIDTSNAVGVEVRAPNSTWSTHADVFLDAVTVTP